MKRIIVAATLPALAGANLQTAKAGDCGWATAGKILTGVAAGVFIANALDCPPAYYPVTYSRCVPCPAPVVYAPPRVVCAPVPVAYVPAPVVVYPRPVFITPRPLVHVNYAYPRGHQGRGPGHGDRW
jgi:hypothetical protein